MGLSHSPSIVTDGLVLCLDAVNPRGYNGATTLYDLSGNNNTSLLQNGASVTNGYFSFDGSNDQIFISRTYPGSLSLTSNVTLEAWVNYRDTGYVGWMQVIDDLGGSPYTSYSMWLSSDSSGGGKFVSSYDNGSWRYSSGNVYPNTWNHIVLSKQANSANTYINTVFSGSISYSNLGGTGGDFTLETNQGTGIGRHPNNSYPFNGYIGLPKIYNRALTPDEVRRNYLATKSRFGL